MPAASDVQSDASGPAGSVSSGRGREHLILWLVALHVCALPWALGGTKTWCQISSFALAIIVFALALLPGEASTADGAARVRFVPWQTLRRFPLFWIGLALVALVVVQALNPAWEYQVEGKTWLMKKIDPIAWLPTGVTVPFAQGGPWRTAMIYSTVWLTVCTVWIGLTGRRVLHTFCLLLAINGYFLALLGLLQRGMGPPTSSFLTFGYKNHGSIYLLLLLGVVVGLAGWHFLRVQQGLEKLKAARLFLFIGSCLGMAILVSRSRGAGVMTAGFLLMMGLWFAAQFFRAPKWGAHPALAIGFVVILGLGLKTGFETMRAESMLTRLMQGVLREDGSLQSRETVTQASIDMLKDVWPAGTGAGSFRFLFEPYQQHYPAIYMRRNRQINWEHAHNDIVQFPIELGLAGTLLLLGGIGYLGVALGKARFWQDPLSLSIVLALAAVVTASWWDYLFQNPAILMLAAVLAVIAVRCARGSNPASRH